MKKELVISLGLALSCLACSKYDDSALYGLLAKLDQRLGAVEEHVKKANEDIQTLKSLVSAASQGKTITEVKKTDEGYDLTFSDKQVISIKMGRDGMDGHSPKISVALDGGVYYWQLDGKWLLDTQGQKVRVSGETGPQGSPGKDGATGPQGSPGKDGATGPQGIPGKDGATGPQGIPGKDGATGPQGIPGLDGKTPKLRINAGKWEVAYGNNDWTPVTVVSSGTSGANSVEGLDLFKNIKETDKEVVITLKSGGTIKLSKQTGKVISNPNNTLNGESIVRNEISSDDYELSYDGLSLIKWKNTGTQNLDMNRDSQLSKITFIGNYAFRECRNLKNVHIASSVTSIGRGAFESCSSLTSIIIPSSVTSIERWAFEGCSSLTSVTIPSSVTSIGREAFAGCSNLTSVNIPNSVTSIGEFTFSGCSSLTSVTIPSSITSIGGGAFWSCSSLTSITIPSSVTSIGEWAFDGCSSLTSVTIPSTVTSIGGNAFSGCRSLTSINIPSSVMSIGGSAFGGCSSLTSVTIPSSVTSIGKWAFSSCRSLTSITIPSSVTSIGGDAFSYCTNLTSVVFKGNNPPRGTKFTDLFIGTPNKLKFIIPKGAKTAYIEAGYPEDRLIEQ